MNPGECIVTIPWKLTGHGMGLNPRSDPGRPLFASCVWILSIRPSCYTAYTIYLGMRIADDWYRFEVVENAGRITAKLTEEASFFAVIIIIRRGHLKCFFNASVCAVPRFIDFRMRLA